jgi:TetR/AcrR family transcriptional regulator
MAKIAAKETKRQNNEFQILAAAEEVFAQHGYNGTTLDLIAERAGLSKQNLLYYFPSKKLLYQSVLESVLDNWLEFMALLDQPGKDPATKLEHYIRGKIEFSRTRPNGSKVYANEIISGAPHLSATMKERLLHHLDADLKLVNRWIAEGKMDAIDPAHLFFMIWAATQTYADFSAQIEIALGKRKLSAADFEDASKFVTHVILKGIGINNPDKPAD